MEKFPPAETLTAAWMLLPLYLWAVWEILKEKGKGSLNVLIAAFALAGIGYADVY